MSLNKNELNITLIHYSNKYKFLELVIFSNSKIIKYKKNYHGELLYCMNDK